MCRSYLGREDETVFQFIRWSNSSIFGLIFVGVAAIMFAFLTSKANSAVAVVVPIVVLLLGILLIGIGGGRWLVFNERGDEVHAVEGYLFNFHLRKIYCGKLSELTGINVTMRYSYFQNNGWMNNGTYYRNYNSQVYYDTTLHFLNGSSRLFTTNSSQTRVNNFIFQLKSWLDQHRAGHNISLGERQLTNTVIVQTVINPNQAAEQELRSLIIRYETSMDITAREKGQKLNLAMEYNASSLVGTYVALKQQSGGITLEGEVILLNSAQTIINVKNNSSVQLQQQMYVQQPVYNQQPTYNQQPMYQQPTYNQQPQPMYIQQPMYNEQQPMYNQEGQNITLQ